MSVQETALLPLLFIELNQYAVKGKPCRLGSLDCGSTLSRAGCIKDALYA